MDFMSDREEKPSKHPYLSCWIILYTGTEVQWHTASYLPVEPGDRVLDLCGAPGGKSTELGAKLMGRRITGIE